MTDEIAQKCLLNNYRQTQIIDSIEKHAALNMYQHARFMRHLEAGGIMNRKLENLRQEPGPDPPRTVDTAVLQQADL
jgi:glutamate dehydrogenase